MSTKPRGGFFGRVIALSVLVAAHFVTLSFTAGAQSAASSQLTIRISSEGITPTSATVSAGIVHLKIENRSGLEHLTLRVSRDDGELVREIALPEKTEQWGTELELKAGQYTLTIAGSTAWVCHLTVQ